MKEQPSPPAPPVQSNTITAEEMKTALDQYIGTLSGNFVCQIAYLEKQIADKDEIILALTTNEARLVEHIQNLETELLERGGFVYEERNQKAAR